MGFWIERYTIDPRVPERSTVKHVGSISDRDDDRHELQYMCEERSVTDTLEQNGVTWKEEKRSLFFLR